MEMQDIKPHSYVDLSLQHPRLPRGSGAHRGLMTLMFPSRGIDASLKQRISPQDSRLSLKWQEDTSYVLSLLYLTILFSAFLL